MKLREIERLRAVAILMVIALHFESLNALLPRLARKAWSGVDLFFVISGYVVGMSLLRTMPSLDPGAPFLEALAHSGDALKRFYSRRFFRIVPSALVVLMAVRACAGAFPDLLGRRIVAAREESTVEKRQRDDAGQAGA